MEKIKFTIEDIYDRLRKEGFSAQEASALAKQLGPIVAQGSNFAPNLAEGTAFTVTQGVTNKLWKPTSFVGKFGKFMIPMTAANLAYMEAMKRTGSNFLDTASTKQLWGDIGGSIIGGIGGQAAGAATGRTIGTALGGVSGGPIGALIGGGIGSILGSALGGWGASKLFKSAQEEALENIIKQKKNNPFYSFYNTFYSPYGE